MGRRRSLTDEQVQEIKASEESTKAVATRLGVSYLTAHKVRKGLGAYAPVVVVTEPVLDAHGVVVSAENAS